MGSPPADGIYRPFAYVRCEGPWRWLADLRTDRGVIAIAYVCDACGVFRVIDTLTLEETFSTKAPWVPWIKGATRD